MQRALQRCGDAPMLVSYRTGAGTSIPTPEAGHDFIGSHTMHLHPSAGHLDPDAHGVSNGNGHR